MTYHEPSGLPLLIANLVVDYGAHRVLNGLDLSIRPGEIYALLGGNGAGKSTTLAAIMGFVPPASGEVRVCGVAPGSAPVQARRAIAYLPENVALYEHLTARENIQYFLGISSERRTNAEIEAAFNAAGLQEDAFNRRVAGFSKGMRQKVAIALALLRHVPLVLLDEPTSGLDPRATQDFNRLLGGLRERGSAVLMVTHDLLSAADTADRIGFLDAGRIVQESVAEGPDRYDVRALHRHFARPVAA
ncbi:ATP-binding cassette domain-containing protein [Novosphingobium sp. FGD1]|uniref:ATP-binding cassette domain-containing protein n=1 Tax=Novosphingobium silvae TaxID=2692619 RepID=A0A7X4GLY2_9SPHN|nr:ABC transporter ATP-binding protein [Novosphingobium silvae]MYM00128.1 ATP-binding cassette domain-containing protein [Novosphingobium silvae]